MPIPNNPEHIRDYFKVRPVTDPLEVNFLALNAGAESDAELIPIRPDDVSTRKLVEGFDEYFHYVPLRVPEAFDPHSLDINLVPEVAVRSFRVETGSSSTKGPLTRVLPELKVLSRSGVNAYFTGLNVSYVPLTEANFDILPKTAYREKKIPKLNTGLFNVGFLEKNNGSEDKEEQPYKEITPIVWSARYGSGIIQATALAQSRYGLTPRLNRGAYPNDGRITERQSPQLPNVNFTFAGREEAEEFASMYQSLGLRHNYSSKDERGWFSAHDKDQIHVVLYPDTDVNDSDQEQKIFIQKMVGDFLKPESEAAIRADGGYPVLLAYVLLKLAIDAAVESFNEHNDSYEFNIMRSDRHTHFDLQEVTKFTVDHFIRRAGTSFLNLLGQRNDHN